MGNQIPTTTSFNLPDGKEVTIETGKLATQAHGSVVIKVENTMLFCSVVSAYEPREGQSFFPLSVDYQEKFAAAGKIPGNFFRREARLSDYEILTSRLVDRALRPLFPDGYMNDTQIIINLISGDDKNMPDAYAALAASAAIAVSDVPFETPISEVRVAKVNGEYIVNPERQVLAEASLEVIVAATMKDVMMVEGEAKECQEAELVEAIKVGHEAIKVQIQAQLDLAAKVGDKATKRVVEPAAENDEVKELVKQITKDKIYKVASTPSAKFERKDAFKAIKTELKAELLESKGEEWMEENGDFISPYFNKLQKEVIRNMVLTEKVRLDGRKTDEVRDIWGEVDYLPAAHGSAIFNRGETQALASLTLGTKKDTLMVDTALNQYYEDFILHYNFPALSVGETKPMRGPGRREVGHANLAGRSIKQVLPDENPYTIRIVADILESNGSSSMATVCSGIMALMDAGIQIKAPVSGIAMGMIADGDNIAILSDILGDEDALGDMDFKVTGTEKGITGCQMDIKIDGLPYSTLEKALTQAKEGRIHILNEMAKAIPAVATDLKPHAPRMIEMVIEKSFIGAVIGPGGKIIQELQEKTNTIINIEEVDDKGMPYGAFVKFAGKSGLVHISEMEHRRIENVSDLFEEGDEIKVKLIGIDEKTGKMRLSRKATLPKPERNDG